MEISKQRSTALPYDTPAVVYEAALVAHAATTTACDSDPLCPACSGADLLQGLFGQ